MSSNNFIPSIWAGEILLNLHKETVFTNDQIVNDDYTGDIKGQGDTVRIGAIGSVTVTPYSRDTAIPDPQFLADAATTLAISQADLIHFAVDDLDARQAAVNLMDGAMYEGGYALSLNADYYVAAQMLNASAITQIGTDTSPQNDLAPSSSHTKAYDYLVDLAVLLNQQNVPTQGRWAIVPPWYYGLLMRDDRFVSFGTTGNIDTRTNGQIDRISGFTIYWSNNSPTTNSGSTYNVIAGHPMATTFAEQIVQMEAYRSQKFLADAVRGLHVYGAKVVRPNALAILKCSNPGF